MEKNKGKDEMVKEEEKKGEKCGRKTNIEKKKGMKVNNWIKKRKTENK